MDVDTLNGELREPKLRGAATDDPAIVRAQWQLSHAPVTVHLRAT
jgi:hypothetical protein